MHNNDNVDKYLRFVIMSLSIIVAVETMAIVGRTSVCGGGGVCVAMVTTIPDGQFAT